MEEWVDGRTAFSTACMFQWDMLICYCLVSWLQYQLRDRILGNLKSATSFKHENTMAANVVS